jgi:uncharacterized protein YqgV (UPF0045/DUF77 family)
MTEHNITLGIQIIPLDTNKDTAYHLVDRAIEIIQKSGVEFRITPFETVMSGKYDELLEICQKAQQAVIKAGAEECLVYYRIHLRTSGNVTFEEKKLDRS